MYKADRDRKKGKKERKRDREMDVWKEEGGRSQEGMSPYILAGNLKVSLQFSYHFRKWELFREKNMLDTCHVISNMFFSSYT